MRSSRDLERLFDLAVDLLCVADADGRLVRVNQAWHRCLGWKPKELVGRRYIELVHPSDRERTAAQAKRLRQPGVEVVEFENRYRHRDGSYRWLAWNASSGPHGAEIYAVARDVTDRRKGDGPRTSSGFYRSVVESSDDAIITKDRDGRILTWNPGAERLYGYSEAEAVGRPISMIIPPARRGEEYEILATALRGERVEHYETDRVTKDGRLLEVSLTVSPLRGEGPDVIGATAIARDITQRKDLERHLRYMADHDALTGLANRRRLAEELERRARHAGRYGRPGALLVIDLDNFKLINDSFGHAEGDRLLVRVSRALAERVRETDVLARLGGDEFAVLLDEVDQAEAAEVAHDLLGTLTRIEHEGATITASIGVAPFDAVAGAGSDDLMVAADTALYQAKDEGRNQLALYRERTGTSLRWVEQIRRAVSDDRLFLDGQPILDLSTGQFTRQELLIRMRSPQGEVVAPDAFLPTAERFGLIRNIDWWVIDRAVSLATLGHAVGVNISGASMCDRDLVGRIESRLSGTGVRPQRMVFEITETAAIANMYEAREFAQRLRELGCGVALDDFGTGFGSFTSLKQLPISYLKIDAQFVRHLKTDRADRHVIDAVVGLAHGLGQKTIAEGVEDRETLRALADHGVDLAQGYHIGRPGPLPPPRRRFSRRSPQRFASLTRAA